MARKKKQSTWMVILTLVVAAAAWYIRDQEGGELLDGKVGVTESGKIEFETEGLTEVKVTTKKFTVLENCTLIEHRHNDGDSFHVKHPDGRDEIRLYFVDAAESRLHQFNAERLAEQGAYFGGLSQAETIKAGKKAKEITLGLLEGKKFTVITKWEMDPSGKRPHAYIVIEKDGKDYYLHEILTRAGLVRTKTRGAELPDGTDFYSQRDKVRAMEKLAKEAKRGAWGMIN